MYIDREKILWRHIGEETVLLNVETGNYYTLDKMAGEIWNRISMGRSAKMISDDLSQEYEVSESNVKEDIDELIATLVSEGVLHE